MSQESSSYGLLLDTHIWVDFIRGDEQLKPATAERIEDALEANAVYVSVMSIWEIAFLVRKGKLTLPLGVSLWAEQAMQLPGTHLVTMTPEIAVRSVELPAALNKDPADRFLVATAELENLTLVTRDKDIIRFAKHHKFSLVQG